MKVKSKLLGGLLAGFMMLVINPVLADGPKDWDQADILQISDELSKAARKLRVECRNSPPKYFDEGTGRHIEFKYHVRHFAWVANQLNNTLEDGAGRDETEPLYNTLAGMEEGFNAYANIPGGAWRAVDRAVENVNEHLSQLSAYYAGN
jgi:hypothetical protein